jgi:hypothetical protein
MIAIDYVWVIYDEHGNRTATTRPEHARSQIAKGLRVLQVKYPVLVETVGEQVDGCTDEYEARVAATTQLFNEFPSMRKGEP